MVKQRKIKKHKYFNRKLNKILPILGICVLCTSIVANIFQASFNISLAKKNQDDSTSLNNYRNLQAEQIEYVRNRCYAGYEKYGSDGQSDANFKEMTRIAVNEAPRYVNVDSYTFFEDLIFDYLQSICLKPLVLLLGSEDIYGHNLNYFVDWGYFHFDDGDFDKVRW